MPTPTAHDPNHPYKPVARLIAAAGVFATALTVQGEGTIFRAYDDARPSHILKVGEPIKGTLTACTGHTNAAGGPPIVIGHDYTKAECDAYLQNDRKVALATVLKYAPELYQNPPTAGAVEDFIFNVGPANFITSSMLRAFNEGRIKEGCAKLYDWKYGRINGIKAVIAGLFRRRDAEYKVCVTGLES